MSSPRSRISGISGRWQEKRWNAQSERRDGRLWPRSFARRGECWRSKKEFTTTLMGGQEIALRVLTAGGVTCVNRWASRQQSHRLYRSAGVLQWSEHRIEVVLVAAVMEIAGIVTA